MFKRTRKRQIAKYAKKSRICPICGYKDYKYEAYAEGCYGIVEQHCYCSRCGYTVEQAYSEPICGFNLDTLRGYRDFSGKYHPKNTKMRARLRKKYNIKHSNQDWYLQYI